MDDSVTGSLALFSLSALDAKMIGVGTVFIFALYSALSSALFKPLLRHIEEREGVTAGALHTASQMRQKAQALRERYDEGMLQARIAANKERNQMVLEAKKVAADTVSKAEAVAASELQAGRHVIARSVEQANSSAEVQAKALAETLSTKVDTQLSVH
jgi:F0F1-type ATP synthase membrane subunit b/b'